MSWIWLDYDGIPALVEANYFSPDKKRLVTITGDKATLVRDFSSSQDKRKGSSLNIALWELSD
jgi:hypothetical protein